MSGRARVVVWAAIAAVALAAYVGTVLYFGGQKATGGSSPNPAGQTSPPQQPVQPAQPSTVASAPQENAAAGIEPTAHEEPDAKRLSEEELAKRETSATGLQRRRAKSSARQFIANAYGYSGDDVEAYREGIVSVTTPYFSSSEGYAEIERMDKSIRDGGVEAAAKATEVEITSVSDRGGKVEATVHFVAGDSYDRYGEVGGQQVRYAQNIELVEAGERYLVSAAGRLQKEEGD